MTNGDRVEMDEMEVRFEREKRETTKLQQSAALGARHTVGFLPTPSVDAQASFILPLGSKMHLLKMMIGPLCPFITNSLAMASRSISTNMQVKI